MTNYKRIINRSLPEPKEVTVWRLDDNTIIPIDPSNTDYQEYLKWLDGYELQGMQWVKTSEGNEPLPADEPS